MRKFIVDLHLNHNQIQAYYAGQVAAVWTRDLQGVRVQFPLQPLRRFVDHNGLRGRFELCVGDDNRLISVDRCADELRKRY